MPNFTRQRAPALLGPSRFGVERRKSPRGAPNAQTSLFADVAAFLIPCANIFGIRLIGELPGGEILTVVFLPLLLLLRGRRVLAGRNKTLLSLLALWFLGQLVTDVYRHTTSQDMMKGLALILFFALDLVALSTLVFRNQRRMALFALGALPALIAQCIGHGYQALRPDLAWKLGYAPILNPAMILITCYLFKRRSYLAMYALDLLLAAANLYFNFRSAALVIAVGLVLLLPLPDLQSTRAYGERRAPSELQSGKARALLTVGLVLFMGLGIGGLYSYTAGSGALGSDAKLKYDLESRGKYGLLVGGRPETLVSWRAVMDSPILGHGSWAKDARYSEILSDQLRATGYAQNDLEARYGDAESSLIPTHSHLMTAWVFSGILGAIFWLYTMAICIRASFTLSSSRLTLAPYFSFLLVLALWDILFSPFASYRRLLVAFVLVVINMLLTKDHETTHNDSPSARDGRSDIAPMQVMPRFRYHD